VHPELLDQRHDVAVVNQREFLGHFFAHDLLAIKSLASCMSRSWNVSETPLCGGDTLDSDDTTPAGAGGGVGLELSRNAPPRGGDGWRPLEGGAKSGPQPHT